MARWLLITAVALLPACGSRSDLTADDLAGRSAAARSGAGMKPWTPRRGPARRGAAPGRAGAARGLAWRSEALLAV